MLSVSAPEEAPQVTAADLYEKTEMVRGQEHARRTLAVLLERQLGVARGEYSRSSGALAGGRTGVGKTYLIRTMCQMCGLPFAEANATQFTDKGYIGMDLSQMFLPLIESAVYQQQEYLEQKYGKEVLAVIEEDVAPDRVLKLDRRILDPAIDLAHSGVILLDEFDKWMMQTDDHLGRNVGKKLQAELLKMIEGGETYVTDVEDEIGLRFDTTKVLIICAGAFVGLEGIISKRIHRDLKDDPEAWEMTEPQDFEKFGLLPELAGRLETHIMFKPLRPEHLTQVIEEENGLLTEYQQRFAAKGVELEWTRAGLLMMAEVALQRKTGARALAHVMARTFGKALFEANYQTGTVVLDVESARREECHVRA